MAYSSDQILVGQPLPGCAFDEAFQPPERVPLDITLVEPKSELVNVPPEMLRADVVERAISAALENRPNALNPFSIPVPPFVQRSLVGGRSCAYGVFDAVSIVAGIRRHDGNHGVGRFGMSAEGASPATDLSISPKISLVSAPSVRPINGKSLSGKMRS
jgi:hypothetical protein